MHGFYLEAHKVPAQMNLFIKLFIVFLQIILLYTYQFKLFTSFSKKYPVFLNRTYFIALIKKEAYYVKRV